MIKSVDPSTLEDVHHRLGCAVNGIEALAFAMEYTTSGVDFLDGLYSMVEHLNHLLNELGSLYEGGSNNDR